MTEEVFIERILEEIEDFIEDNKVTSEMEKSRLMQKLLDGFTNRLQLGKDVEIIEAANVVVEVRDEATGCLFRRYLEIGYVENSNGLRISGEMMDGTPTHIAFLSDSAISRLYELKGSGQDEPRCK